jgi:hypothetical protein
MSHATPPAKPIPLTVLPPARPRAGPWRGLALRLYRLGVVAAIVFLVHRHHARLRVDGDAPVTVTESRPFFPDAARLETDPSARGGLFVLGPAGEHIGYLLRTSPVSDDIRGYSGPTDTLIAMDNAMRVVGIQIRSSWDTKEHVRDVAANEYFMKTWNGRTWDQVAGLDPRAAGIEGVSGASLTSMAIANAIQHRFKRSLETAATPLPRPRFGPHDVALVVVIALACAFTFSGRLRGHTWWRRAFQLVLIGYVGFWNGQLLAQSLVGGWAATGVAWRMAPALALLAAAALVVPWTSRRALYCTQICPHGAAQEWVGRLTRRNVVLPRGVEAGLRWLPALLIALTLAVTILRLPFNLAAIEPFDAYLIRTAGVATIAIAVVGLVAAAFVPMAYCKYGCPTGMVLNFVRSHGRADAPGRRDVAAAIMVVFAATLCAGYEPIHRWILR